MFEKFCNPEKQKNRRKSCLNKAVIPAIWYSLFQRPLLVYGCGHALYQVIGLYRGNTRKPTKSCNGLLNRLGKGLTPFARIHFRSHSALFSFTNCAIRACTGLLQRLHCTISLVRCPQCEEETASLRIEGKIHTWASGLLSGSASARIHSTIWVSHPAVGRASSRAF